MVLDIIAGHMNLILILLCCVVIFILLIFNIIAFVLLIVVLVMIVFKKFDYEGTDLKQPLNRAIASAGSFVSSGSKIKDKFASEEGEKEEIDISHTRVERKPVKPDHSSEKKTFDEGDVKVVREAIAQWDFNGQDGELSFKTGEVLQILETDDEEGDGWVNARNVKTGETGLAPGVYLEFKDQ